MSGHVLIHGVLVRDEGNVGEQLRLSPRIIIENANGPVGRGGEPGDHPEERRFAGTVRSEKASDPWTE
jgi:hypothetical protein